MKPPLLIIIELLVGLITNTISTLALIWLKLGELFVSLAHLSSFDIFGFFLAVVIGALVFVFVAKFFFKTWKSLFALGIAFAAVILVLILISLL